MADEIMVCASFCYENNEGGSEGDLRCIRNTSSGEYDDDCDEVEEVVVDQGCDRLLKVKSLFVSRENVSPKGRKISARIMRNLY